MDHPPPDPNSAKAEAETAAARAVAAEESARQHAWRASARSSTTVIPKPARTNRLLLPILAVSSILLTLTCAFLFQQMRQFQIPDSATPRRPTTTARVPTAAQAPALPTTVAPVIPPVAPDAPALLPPSTPPPSPLVITIPTVEPTAAPATPPPPTITLSAEERRQLQLYERRLVSGTDLLSRDLTEREQTVGRLQRRLTFEPDRQPPLGALEELAEATRQWEGAVGDERDRLAAAVHNRRAEVANVQRQLVHDQEVAESLRKRLQAARQELDEVRKKLGPPP